MNEQTIIAIVMVAQMTLIPFLVNKIGLEKAKKLVPMVNLVVSILTQLAAGFETAAQPPTAPAVAYHQAGFFADFGNSFLNLVLNALVQTAIPTGLHSGAKNTIQFLGKK